MQIPSKNKNKFIFPFPHIHTQLILDKMGLNCADPLESRFFSLINTANVFSLSYDYLSDIFFSLANFIHTHIFDCMRISASNPSVVQRSTVLICMHCFMSSYIHLKIHLGDIFIPVYRELSHSFILLYNSHCLNIP